MPRLSDEEKRWNASQQENEPCWTGNGIKNQLQEQRKQQEKGMVEIIAQQMSELERKIEQQRHKSGEIREEQEFQIAQERERQERELAEMRDLQEQ